MKKESGNGIYLRKTASSNLGIKTAFFHLRKKLNKTYCDEPFCAMIHLPKKGLCEMKWYFVKPSTRSGFNSNCSYFYLPYLI